MFQIKDFRSILASIINRAQAQNARLTDWSVGSVARTLAEAPAAEIEELYLQMLLGLQEAMPVSIYQAFGFERLQALPATGLVRFSALSAPVAALRLPAGTQVKAPSSGAVYATQLDAELPAGQTTVDVLVSATAPGAASNAPAGAAIELVSAINGIDAVNNLLPLQGGQDTETDTQRKTRFVGYIGTLSRGTGAALRYGASTVRRLGSAGEVVETVAHAEVIEPHLTNPALPVGLVRVYVHNGVGATTSALVAKVLQVLTGYRGDDGLWVPGYKAAGVFLDVLASPEALVNVAATLTLDGVVNTAATLTAAQDAARAYVAGLPVGASVQRASIIALLMALPGVRNVALSLPAADVAVQAFEKAMPGTVSMLEAP